MDDKVRFSAVEARDLERDIAFHLDDNKRYLDSVIRGEGSRLQNPSSYIPRSRPCISELYCGLPTPSSLAL